MYLSIALFAPALALETGKVGQNISGLTFRFACLVQYYFKWLHGIDEDDEDFIIFIIQRVIHMPVYT